MNSDILVPADGDAVTAGSLSGRGSVFAGDDRRVVRVDVSTDGGQRWQPAELLEDLGPWAWRHWRTEGVLDSGPAELVARAEDSSAATQPEDPARIWNPKGYANNAWARITLRRRILIAAPAEESAVR